MKQLGILCHTTCFGAILLSFVSPLGTTQAAEPKPAIPESHKVLGVSRADCKKCHVSEVAAWEKTVHYLSAEQRLFKYEANTKKYADALGVSADGLLESSACSKCHGTVAEVAGVEKVISGVSCESCHGPSGGDDGWLNPHQSYGEGKKTRAEETPDHKAARYAKIDAAGMLRSTHIYKLAQNCNSCHIVSDEKLIAAGHKANSAAFDFVGWSEGEVKHNFFMDKATNSDAPTLWVAENPGIAEPVKQRRRIKLVLGTFATLEAALRARANATNPAVIPTYGGMVAGANGKFAQMLATGNPQIAQIPGLIGPKIGLLFAPGANDKKDYNDLADQVAKLAEEFAAGADKANLAAVDAMTQTIQPHYSQQYIQKHGKP